MFGRALAIVGFGLALSTAGCSIFPDSPMPTPVTVDQVRAAFDNSNMKSAHFSVEGSFIKGANRFDVTGDGVLQRVPAEALQMNLIVLTYSAQGDLHIEQITIGGRLYTRVGTGQWTSTPETASPTTPTSYVGEETIAATLAWHVRSAGSGNTYDMWVRESDGYIAYLKLTDPTGSTFNMSFNSYNNSPVVVAP